MPPASANIINSPVSVSVLPQTVKEQKLPVKVDNENGDDPKESFQDQINRDAAQLHKLGWSECIKQKRKHGP